MTASDLSPKENMIRVLNHQVPGYMPFQLESIVPLFHRDALFYARNGDPSLSVWTDAWGVNFMIPEDMNDDSGFPTSHPLTSLDDLDSFPWPDAENPGLFAANRNTIAELDRDQVLLAGMNPAILFVRSWLLYGMDNLLMGTAMEKAKVAKLLDRITDYQVTIARGYLKLGIDIAHMGDDIGTTQALMMNPESWRELIKPRLKRIIDTYKQGGCYIYFHSCGRIMDILEDLIELGVDILNPLQAGANDLGEIRRRTAGKTVLHGGIDCDMIMRASPAEIRRKSAGIIELLGRNGEYIADADQALPFPMENINAVEEAVRAFGTYSQKRLDVCD